MTQIFTVFGQALLLEVRPDGIHVARTPRKEILFIQAKDILLQQKTTAIIAGTQLDTPYGKGVVKRQRAQDGILEVELPQWRLSTGQCVVVYMNAQRASTDYSATSNGRISSILKYTSQSIKIGGSSMRMSATGGFSSVRNRLSTLAGSSASTFRLGERVLTPFGSGFVKAIRYDDGYVLKLRRLGITAYIQPHSVRRFAAHQSHYVVENTKPTNAQQTSQQRRRQIMRQVTSIQAQGHLDVNALK